MFKKFWPLILLFVATPLFAQTTPLSVTLRFVPTTSTTSTYGYNIYRGTTSGGELPTPITPLTSPNGVTCVVTPTPQCTYIDTAANNAPGTPALVAGQPNYYYVKTVDLSSKAMSVPSNEAEYTIPAPPAAPNAPTNLTAGAK